MHTTKSKTILGGSQPDKADSEATSNSAIAGKLSGLPVSSAMDILRDMGAVRSATPGISAITAVKGTVAGPVRTVRYLPTRIDCPRAPGGSASMKVIDDIRQGEVLVLAAMGFRGGAVLGDMMAWRARHRGAAAIVADGAVRDIAGIEAAGLMVFARGMHPASGMDDIMPWEADVPVACDGVLVRPGDWVLADRDAVAFVPHSLLSRLVQKADEATDEEEFCLRLLKRGHELRDVHPLTPGLRQHLERFRRDGRLPSTEEVRAAGTVGD